VSGTWSETGALARPRSHHTATLLPNGQVLAAAGLHGPVLEVLASAELYDPASGIWTPTDRLLRPRYDHTATLLTDGKVLAAGGTDYYSELKTAELYDVGLGFDQARAARHWRRECYLAESSASPYRVAVTNGIPGEAEYVVVPP
jgi:hypothetical protein